MHDSGARFWLADDSGDVMLVADDSVDVMFDFAESQGCAILIGWRLGCSILPRRVGNVLRYGAESRIGDACIKIGSREPKTVSMYKDRV